MRRSLRSWVWQVPIDREVEEELAFHLEMRTRALVERGVDPQTARDLVLARAGDLDRIKRTCVDLGRKRDRERRLTRWLEEFRDDTRFAVRQMTASPGFTLVAVLTLALGIGANSAMFAVADAAFLRPLPFAEADRLVRVLERRGDGTLGSANPLDFFDWRDRNRTFAALAAVTGSTAAVTGPDGVAEQVPALVVTSGFFDVLGVAPLAGRTFQPADDTPASAVVVLGEALWRSRFGGDPALVGRAIHIGGQTVTVIGVVPAAAQIDFPGTNATGAASVWRLFFTPQDRTSPAQRRPHYLQVIGRLAPGVTLEAARVDLTAIAETLEREWPATNHGHGVALEPLRSGLIGSELRLTSWLLLGVVGFVLLLCCANVANLILARIAERTRELAVRSAIGAGRRRIVRQLLTESLVLGALGGFAGAVIGAGVLRVVPSLVPAGLLPVTAAIGFDGRVLAFCAAAALAVAIACGIVPAWQVTGVSLLQAVGMGGGRTTTERGARLRTMFATGQVAVAVLLLCGAGLLLRTLAALDRVESGARAGDGVAMAVHYGISGNPEAMRRYYAALEREVGAVAGVRQVALGSALPLDGLWHVQGFQIAGDPQEPGAGHTGVGYQIVSASYFETLEIAILRGRGFTTHDTAGGTEVCIVDEAFVRRYLEDREPLGVRLAVQTMTMPPRTVVREIVGVVAHVRERPGEIDERPHIYVPIAQDPWWTATLVVRPAADVGGALAPQVQAAVARVDRTRPATAIRTLDDIASAATARPRFRAALVGAFAGLALALAMAGVFGVMAHSVQQRVREFGVRLALGASAADVFRLVLTRAARIAAVGTAVGFVAAAFLSGGLSAMIFGVRPLDPVTFAATAVTIVLTAIAASAVPALRAARVDPRIACREE